MWKVRFSEVFFNSVDLCIFCLRMGTQWKIAPYPNRHCLESLFNIPFAREFTYKMHTVDSSQNNDGEECEKNKQ